MVFVKDDIYTSSGSVKLWNSWTPYVTKYDTSSFYSWEQDNLPLYDLEERSYELWEQQGFPTSSVPGLSLVVSADAPLATFVENSMIFRDVSSCMAAIPKVIRFPVLVEICNFGSLGNLDLHNIKIEERGSLEIINRAYGKVYTASGLVEDSCQATLPNASHKILDQFQSNDLSATLFTTSGPYSTSSIILSSLVLSGPGDARVSSVNTFMYPQLSRREAPLSVSLKENNFLGGASPYYFRTTPWIEDVAAGVDDTIRNQDASALNQYDQNIMTRKLINTLTKTGGSTYLNYLDRVSVHNCDGPIYVRNFCVNGESATNSGRAVGFGVNNSNVVLENCAATRCREAGFKFNNSKVVLSRSAFSYRNYELEAPTARKSNTGIGFHAVNSDVSISALLSATTETGIAGDFQASGQDVMVVASRNYVGFQLDGSKLHGGFQREFAINEDTGGTTVAELNTGHGVVVNNSQIDLKGLLDIYGNHKGIIANSSEVVYQNLCVDRHTNAGLEAKNSNFTLDSRTAPTVVGEAARRQVDFLCNGQHIDLAKQSSFGFARKNNIPSTFGHMSFSGAHGVIRWGGAPKANIPAITVEDSSEAQFLQAKIVRDATSSVPNVPSYGVACRAINNSNISFYGTGSGATFLWGPAGYTYQAKSAGLYADSQSTINVHGPTLMAQYGVDVLAENQSTINIMPPKVRASYGMEVSAFDLSSQANHTSVELHATRACLVANKNSTINLEDLGAYPAFWSGTTAGRSALTDGLDYPVGTFDNSAFMAFGSLQFFPNPQDPTTVIDQQVDNLLGRAAMSFTSVPGFPVFTQQTSMNQLLIADNPIHGTADFAARAKASLGGVCVRAVADSVVNVTNVHFPHGNADSPLDGIIYNVSGTTCDRLMIWNMADTSRLNAAYCSVSGEYPVNSAYHGPSAIYASSFNGTITGHGNEVPASGAPSGTPDTGNLSILDAFGAGSACWAIPSGIGINDPFGRYVPVNPYITTSSWEWGSYIEAGLNCSDQTIRRYGAANGNYNNKGVFRIYWSPKAEAKFLASDQNGYLKGGAPHPGAGFDGVLGPPYQIFSQGYNMSAGCSAVIPPGWNNASSTYPSLLKYNIQPEGTGVWFTTSGFYYCKEFVEDNPIQTMVDDSGSNTFANSKNASVGSSGRPRKVTVYRAKSDDSQAASPINYGAEAFQGSKAATIGYKSSNIFDLKRDN